MPDELPELIVFDAIAWHEWLDEHHAAGAGDWLRLAKKGTTVPTSLTYDQALDEALCSGWIDGQVRRADQVTFAQRFTPRRLRSVWSQRNTALIERLTAQGRMRPAGLAQVERAKADGRWAAAYAGSRTIEVPDDLATALANDPAAAAMFATLDRQDRYAVLLRLHSVKQATTRAARIVRTVELLRRGEVPHPHRPTP
ncbi:YdeI family protein [uncultured Amnibacterium sp.]|uniref:YdeI/OmpD-associated family protein n=1 Tax=uncultured Amnibacterium sp. TaxID=1631851 RepID=UPI0035CC3D45